ncbi:MAG: RNA 2',3'-cyclic phosphodiesterase [Thermoleophilia bacterium]|nr:RNA 2',3'-cyclic phosphodiesterase [Thermoleophilia bacterium]GIK78081.1 MAG: hypothetical protein BroJett022_17710 [Actinomycetes bacterium]
MVEAGERRGADRVRAFIALAPPPATVDAIGGWQRAALSERPGLRPIAPDALHLTLVFLGDCDRDRIEAARRALARASAPAAPVPIRLERPIGLPGRRPRVVAFAATSPAAVGLHRRLRAELDDGDPARPGPRPFRPHLSVARVRGDPRGRRAREAVAGLPPLAGPGHTFDAVRVALYRSQLRSQGARYSVLADVDLPQSGG